MNIIRNIVTAIVLIGIIGGGCLGACACGRAIDYAQGERFGVIVKASEKGIFWNTHEAELVRSGDGIAVMEPWSFSVVDPVVWQQVLDAAASGHRVRVRYEQHVTLWPWEGDTQYLAVAVEPLQ